MHQEYSVPTTRSTSTIRLLLVDDQLLVSHALKAMLELEADLQVVGIANDGNTAIQQIATLQPDLVLMEVQMPIYDGRSAMRAIHNQFPSVKVLMLTSFDDDQYITDSLQTGAKGYLLKDMPCDELVQAIRMAHRGYSQIAPGLLNKLISNSSQAQINVLEPTLPNVAQLTPREQDVLRLIREGATNREIAEQLYISESTVKTHVTRLLTRLNMRNRAQLAIYANAIQQAV
ncbi:MAG: response regulator transcription factor [Elainellaceae cyanobacterium]